MGMMKTILGIGKTAKDLSEVFVANRTAQDENALDRFRAVQLAYRQEFTSSTRFDHIVNGLNRLPRPLMALGTLGLFAHAMTNPSSFAVRMDGLSHVPDPLWWLLGAVVSFYFGARELHHFRAKVPKRAVTSTRPQGAISGDAHANAALEEWYALSGKSPDWLDE
ncbi:MAG: holin family protein [Pseudomonadota bacterium]